MPAAFTQPGDHLLAEPCSVTAFCVGNNRSADASVVYAIVLGWPDGDVLRVSAPRINQGTMMSLVGLDGSNLQYRYITYNGDLIRLVSGFGRLRFGRCSDFKQPPVLAGWLNLAKLSLPHLYSRCNRSPSKCLFDRKRLCRIFFDANYVLGPGSGLERMSNHHPFCTVMSLNDLYFTQN